MNIDLSKIFYRMRKRILLDFSNNILTNRINTLDNHKKCIYVMYERDGFTVTAIFASIYAVLKGFTLISTKA